MDDDLDSDTEYRTRSGRELGRILEEGGRRRIQSYISSASDEDDDTTVSDYVGFDDKDDMIV